MPSSLIAPFLLTAPGREAILAGTLASWEAACRGNGNLPLGPGPERQNAASLLAPLVIHHDPHREDPRAVRPLPPMTRLLAAYHSLLTRAVAESTAPLLLLLEDDLAFAPGLPARLAAWSPLRPGLAAWENGASAGEMDAAGETPASAETPAFPAMASLFRPRVIRPLAQPAPDCLSAEPVTVLGTQALLLTRAFAARAAAEWPALEGFQSQRLAALAARLGHPILYHVPSLVQHTGTVSAWGGFIHRAVDFGWYEAPRLDGKQLRD